MPMVKDEHPKENAIRKDGIFLNSVKQVLDENDDNDRELWGFCAGAARGVYAVYKELYEADEQTSARDEIRQEFKRGVAAVRSGEDYPVYCPMDDLQETLNKGYLTGIAAGWKIAYEGQTEGFNFKHIQRVGADDE